MTVQEQLAAFLVAHGGEQSFLEHQVKEFLRGVGLLAPAGRFIPAGAGIPSPLGLRFPLVAKVASRCIVSKSDVGGVRLGIASPVELEEARKELLEIDGAEGVLVEETAPPGVEVIVGGTIDPQFGPVVMFGLGGLFVELFRDVAFALAPITREDALRLTDRARGSRLLHGFRDRPPVDREALAGIIVTVADLVASGLVAEVDLNPVALYPDGALVLDGKIKRRMF